MPVASLRATAARRVLDGFGMAQRSLSLSARPRGVDELADLLVRARDEGLAVSFRGAGRSYGDASLNSDGLAIDIRGLDRVLAFDPVAGTIDAEAGVSIEGLWRTALPQGWWPYVVPGTMYPTLGGCVAMNIHGKNCFAVGPFGDHVLELDLLTADGRLRTLGPTREPNLFRAVIGGLGLLGAVTRVKLQLKRVESGRLRVRPIQTATLEAMFDCFEERCASSDYLVGWIDAFATGAALGRGIVHQANYLSAAHDPGGPAQLALERQGLPPSILGVPRSIVWRFMKPVWNDFGVKLVNAAKYHIPEGVGADGTFLEGHVAFAFLLDYVPGWRYAYLPRGFIQYQLFLPDGTARAGLRKALELCQRRGVVSYLGVFKRHRADEFLISHGLDGWSLALDFAVPSEPQRLWDTTRELTDLVLAAGGRFYAAKDSVVSAEAYAQAYGERWTRFRALRHELDPGRLFQNDQARRLGLA